MDSAERVYEYKPRWWTIFFGAAFFGIGAVVFGVTAAGNDRGLIINRIIELGPDGATAFFWTLSTICIGLVVISASLACHGLTFRQRLTFGSTAFTMSVSRWSRSEKEIAYQNILELSEETFYGQRLLYITHVDGKDTLAAVMLPSNAVFDEVCTLLSARIRRAHSAEQRSLEC